MGRRFVVAIPLILALATGVRGQILPEGFHSEVLVDTGLNSPTCMCVAPDGTIYIADKQGALLVWREGSGLLPYQFFAGAPLEVNWSGEQGLIGVALDPDFESNRYVYVHYTATSPNIHGRISRFTADASGDLALAGSEVVLLDLNPLATSIHNGGALHFGPDGMLYVGVGENAVSSNSQSIDNLLGKILRINPEPGNVIPPDNPTSFPGISGSPTGDNRAIWAVGLRNPFTFAFQPGTGRMFINDVGAGSYEEIDEGLAGHNYGWPATEGSFDSAAFPDFSQPVFTYSHSAIDAVWGSCILGGTFYNPPAPSFPPSYVGDYLFADYGHKWIKRLDLTTGEVFPFAWEVGSIVDVRVDPQGRLVFVEFFGDLVRVDYSPPEPQCNVHEEQKIKASDAATGDYFGYAIAIDGDIVIVGARGDDNPGQSLAGSAYVFSRTGPGWAQAAKLTASDAAGGDEFGISVAASAQSAIVGAWKDDHAGGSNAGSAYIFVYIEGAWNQQAKLIASDAASNDMFGFATALSGDTALVGAYGNDNAGGAGSGAAYVFVRTGGIWTEQAKLTASDGAAGDQFGYSVAISGDSLVVGAMLDDNAGGTDAGCAYVYERSGGTWTETAKPVASDAGQSDNFGKVAIDGDTIVIGSYRDDVGGIVDAGSAYVFVRSDEAWIEQAKLTVPDARTDDRFGWDVDIEGDLVCVGAAQRGFSEGGSQSGTAFLFGRHADLWTQRARLTASDAAPMDLLGFSVSLSDEYAAVGAVYDDDSLEIDNGSAYFFEMSPFGLPGDLDGDDDVDETDVNILIDVLIDQDTDPDHVFRADLDCSGTVDGRDVGAYVELLLSN